MWGIFFIPIDFKEYYTYICTEQKFFDLLENVSADVMKW